MFWFGLVKPEHVLEHAVPNNVVQRLEICGKMPQTVCLQTL